MVTKQIEALKVVEAQNFNMRKNLLEYDDVMNLQRKRTICDESLWKQRMQVIDSQF